MVGGSSEERDQCGRSDGKRRCWAGPAGACGLGPAEGSEGMGACRPCRGQDEQGGPLCTATGKVGKPRAGAMFSHQAGHQQAAKAFRGAPFPPSQSPLEPRLPWKEPHRSAVVRAALRAEVPQKPQSQSPCRPCSGERGGGGGLQSPESPSSEGPGHRARVWPHNPATRCQRQSTSVNQVMSLFFITSRQPPTHLEYSLQPWR